MGTGIDFNVTFEVVEEERMHATRHGAFLDDAQEHLRDEVLASQGENGGDFVRGACCESGERGLDELDDGWGSATGL